MPQKPNRKGAQQLFIAVYAIFALAASARALFQIATKFSEAPLAFSLSAVAAVVYILVSVSLIKGSTAWLKVLRATLIFELVGVVSVGILSFTDPAAFAHPSVWSGFGQGYGYLPLLLPIAGLVWLSRHRDATNS
jgi:hypothetical protein